MNFILKCRYISQHKLVGLTMMYAQSVSIGYKHLVLWARVHEIVYVFGGPSENVSPQ
jgi:hypothetical protein